MSERNEKAKAASWDARNNFYEASEDVFEDGFEKGWDQALESEAVNDLYKSVELVAEISNQPQIKLYLERARDRFNKSKESVNEE